MAKRLTDTGKWKDDWYLSLSNDYKIIWQWLLDNCDHAGVCKRSLKLMNLMCSTDVSEEEMIQKMEGRVLVVDNVWFIPKFLKFQYPTLQSQKPVIVSVVNELVKRNLEKLIPESFGNDYLIIKDKSKDKDKDKYSLTQKSSKHEKATNTARNFKAQGEELFRDRIGRAGGEETDGSGTPDR
jgi:hypothetical protein